MRNAAGQRLSLELTTGLSGSVQDEPRQVTQALAQRQLRDVGIEIIPVTFPSRVFFSEILPKRRFTGLAMYAWILEPTQGCEGLYTLRDIPSGENGWNGQNYPGYRNPEMDTLCRTAAAELDPERRHALLRRTQVIYARDLPTLSLSTWGLVALVNVGLENFRPKTRSSEHWWNVHTWYWK
jgi:peptide/nickel transport system substrate-binding protein